MLGITLNLLQREKQVGFRCVFRQLQVAGRLGPHHDRASPAGLHAALLCALLWNRVCNCCQCLLRRGLQLCRQVCPWAQNALPSACCCTRLSMKSDFIISHRGQNLVNLLSFIRTAMWLRVCALRTCMLREGGLQDGEHIADKRLQPIPHGV